MNVRPETFIFHIVPTSGLQVGIEELDDPPMRFAARSTSDSYPAEKGATPHGKRQFREILGAVSQENLELVTRWVGAINRADADELIELADPSVDYLPYLGSVFGEGGAYRGHDGLRKYVRDLDEAWSAYSVEIHRLEDLGDEVLMEGRLRATGRSSGLEVDAEMAWLHSFRAGTGKGRYVGLRFFPNREAALAAARPGH
jgi:ketosteroid isomerase-like protein